VVGDSISAGYGLNQNEGWVHLLQQRLSSNGYPHQVVNASISGDTSSGGLQRINNALKKHAPDIVIIELGANDGLRGLSLKQLESNLSKMITLSQNNKASVLILGMQLPPNYGPAYTKAFSNVYLSVSKNKRTALLPFLFTGFESDLSLFQKDRIHPNVDAQELILNNVWPTLLPLLKLTD